MSIPDIRADSRGWFRYFDTNHTGTLEKTEVIRAFVQTFGSSCDPVVLKSVVTELWPLFDKDGSETITESEFLSPEGLCETILAQFATVRQPAPKNGSTASTSISLKCWNCHNMVQAQPPAGICLKLILIV